MQYLRPLQGNGDFGRHVLQLKGHKQIFSTKEIAELLESLEMEVVFLRKFHELSFPYSYYLKKILKKDWLVKLALPIATLFLVVISNKKQNVGRCSKTVEVHYQ